MSRRSVLLLLVFALGAAGVLASAEAPASHATTGVTASNLGSGSPTFVGSAATGCNTPGCSLLTGPYSTPSTANLSASAVSQVTQSVKNAQSNAAADPVDRGGVLPFPFPSRDPVDPPAPSVSCQPMGPGCDSISSSAGSANTALGLNAVDNGTMQTNLGNPNTDVEPPDQGLCTGGNYVVETNNVGEILVFNTELQRQSGVIPLDTLMGLTGRGWTAAAIRPASTTRRTAATGSTPNSCRPAQRRAEARSQAVSPVLRTVATRGSRSRRARVRSGRTTSISSTPTTTRASLVTPNCSTTSPRSG